VSRIAVALIVIALWILFMIIAGAAAADPATQKQVSELLRREVGGRWQVQRVRSWPDGRLAARVQRVGPLAGLRGDGRGVALLRCDQGENRPLRLARLRTLDGRSLRVGKAVARSNFARSLAQCAALQGGVYALERMGVDGNTVMRLLPVGFLIYDLGRNMSEGKRPVNLEQLDRRYGAAVGHQLGSRWLRRIRRRAPAARSRPPRARRPAAR
jgi:hypothetical protein